MKKKKSRARKKPLRVSGVLKKVGGLLALVFSIWFANTAYNFFQPSTVGQMVFAAFASVVVAFFHWIVVLLLPQSYLEDMFVNNVVITNGRVGNFMFYFFGGVFAVLALSPTSTLWVIEIFLLGGLVGRLVLALLRGIAMYNASKDDDEDDC